jgi:hypothetical protein
MDAGHVEARGHAAKDEQGVVLRQVLSEREGEGECGATLLTGPLKRMVPTVQVALAHCLVSLARRL